MRHGTLPRFCLGAALLAAASHLCTQVPAAPDSAPPGKPSGINIVFVGAPMFDEKIDGGEGVYQGSYHWRDGYIYARSATYHWEERTMGPVRPGKNLFAFIGGRLRQLTFLRTGAVFKPEPSFDGKKVLFSMRRDGQDWYHLCEINVDGTQLRQLTDGPFNDFAGAYLPDDRIVFVSDRTGFLEEYHEERTECLFVMNGDGAGIHQITFMPGTYFEPSVMHDGRILFSFWDAFHIDVPPLDKHETVLMTVHPDGTEERHLFGVGQYQFFDRERHSGVGLTQARELPDSRILCQSELGPTLIDLSRGISPRDSLTPVFPGTTSVQLGGTTHRVHLSPLGTRSTAYPLADGRFLYSATPPGARASAISVCDPDRREEHVVVDIPNYAEFDAVPVLVERQRPRKLARKLAHPEHYSGGLDSPNDRARFLVVAGRTSDNPQREEALKRARYLRVIEAEYSGVTTSSHTNLESRILGVVPILPDGSAYFEAPADTPIFLDALDAAGNRILQEWGHPNTSVPVGSQYPMTQLAYMVGRAGETKACYGCHATQTDAVPNVTIEALKYPPVSVRRQSTDLEYRRNEPEAYRTEARIGEAGKYRAWLQSKDPERQSRACAMLALMDDATEADAAAIAELLRADVQGSPLLPDQMQVSRAAAMALTRLATMQQKELLERVAKNSADSMAQHHAHIALENLTFTGRIKDDLEAIGRLGSRASPQQQLAVRDLLAKEKVPPVAAIRAAGKLKDPDAVALLSPWLRRHEWEYHAGEAAVALGRIATPEAVAALWSAVRSEVPNKQVVYARYLQHGPRPEEYALLKGLMLAHAKPKVDDVPYLIALLPNTFMEKPRFEDRMRPETQRVLMPRLLLESAGLRKPIVQILIAALEGSAPSADSAAVYDSVLKGINLERPFSEHGRPFPVVKSIGPEEALWLLTCLAYPGEVPEGPALPYLTSRNHRERIDSAVLLGLQGFGPKGAAALLAEASKAYSFSEMWSIGKGMPDDNFRDKAYMAMALADRIDDPTRLKPLADPTAAYRDVRYGLVRGLARRGKPDAIPLLVEMAARDPLTIIRQQSRYAVADIQDACRLRGETPPAVNWLKPEPAETLFAPRPLSWADTEAEKLPEVTKSNAPPSTWLHELLAPANFRNLNMAQIRGAEHMMIHHVNETVLAFNALDGAQSHAILLENLKSPYPFANYLAALGLARRQDRDAIPALIAQLDACIKAQNTVGFWWCCEALASLRADAAMPALAKYATATKPAGVFGPPGIMPGYVVAKAIGQIAGNVRHPQVMPLLTSDNMWLRAGVLRGLADARAEGIDHLLHQAIDPENTEAVRQEARVQLRRLQK